MTLRLTRLDAALPVVTSDGRPTHQFLRLYNKAMEEIEGAVNTLATTLDNVIELNDLITGLEEATQAANEAAANANNANAAAALLQKVRDSYSPPGVLSASDNGPSAAIAISAHNRVYLVEPLPGKGTSIALGAGAIPGLSYETEYFVYYDDPELEGGSVTYQASLTNEEAVASADNVTRHFIGFVTTPAAGVVDPVQGEEVLPYWKRREIEEPAL